MGLNLSDILEDSTPLSVGRAESMLGVLLLRVEENDRRSSQTLTALGQAVEGLTSQVADLKAEVGLLRADIATLKAKPPPSGCLKDILAVLRTAGRRLTTTRLLEELAKAGYEWSETTVKHVLAAAVASGGLTNEQKEDQRGYGLPDNGIAE